MKRKLQVFISSTYEDMLEERKVAVEAILQSGHIPAGMELFTSGDESQWEIIKKWIDESDVFLLILGGRYGSIEKKSGKSYIQLEYEYALDKKKPFFTLVLDEKEGFKLKEDRFRKDEKINKVIEIDNIIQYKEFRKKVVEEKMVFFYKESNEIKPHIILKLQEIENKQGNLGWISVAELNKKDELFIKYLMLLENEELDSLNENALHETWYSKLIEDKTIYNETVNMYSLNESSWVWGSIEGNYAGNINKYSFVGALTKNRLYCIFISLDKRDYEMGMFDLGISKLDGKQIFFGKTIFMSKIKGEEFLKSPYVWTKEEVDNNCLLQLKPNQKKDFIKIINRDKKPKAKK